MSGYHRKHAIRLLKGETGNHTNRNNSGKISQSRRIYNEAVKEALIVLWEAADRICGKRLKAILPSLVDAMERHGHLNLDSELRKQLLKVSAATIDRLLTSIRDSSQSRRKRHRPKKAGKQIPFPVLGIDSDNDSAFINDTLLEFCRKHHIEFTRSRAYHKNDQAWVEQKNGAIIRRMVGHERFSGVVACQALAHLYQAARLYVNYFQPSFKLRNKTRDGFKVKRTYESPATPCDRLLKDPAVDDQVKEKLQLQRKQLDPVKLLHRIRQGQSALSALTSTDHITQGPGRESLEQFLTQLSRLWRDGEVRPTHRKKTCKNAALA